MNLGISVDVPRIDPGPFRFGAAGVRVVPVDFPRWLKLVSPTWTWDWNYQRHILGYIQRFTAGEINRLMLFMPPRHGKSEMVTIRYPVWRIENNQAMRVIVGAYNQTLADKFSRKARRIARERFPLSEERKAADDWETISQGGMRAVGVGAGVTGMGANLIIIDDPVKNREEASSEAYRDRVWDWYSNDLYTRLEPCGQIILIMTRWHEDDLAGRILSSSDSSSWTVVNLPAEAEEGDPLGRAPGEPLCPQRFDKAALSGIRTVLGRDYYALYQQRPVPREGEIFRREWFEIVDAVPAGARRIRYWDKAGTSGGGAHTAGVLLAEKDGIYYIENVKRGQWGAADREKVIRQAAELDGKSTKIWIEQEPGSGGKESAEATIRSLAGFVVSADKVTGDKVLRAEPLAAQAMAGNVKVLKGDWNACFLDEVINFPSGSAKDQIDAASGAFNKLAVPRGVFFK